MRIFFSLVCFNEVIDFEVEILKHKSVWKLYMEEAHIMMWKDRGIWPHYDVEG